jgi:20S proteasome subunit beta 1
MMKTAAAATSYTTTPTSDTLHQTAVSLGTSIMAATFKDGVILGADSRTTTGSYIANRVSDKLTPLHPHIMCCRSGSAADTQALCDAARYQLELLGVVHGRGEGGVPVKWAASVLRGMCYENREQLQAGLIVAGWDETSGGQVYSIPLGGSLHKHPFAISGSGSSYIYGWCDANWPSDRLMEQEEAVRFVTSGLALAMARDGSSGGVIRLAIITKAGVERRTILPANQPVFYTD